MATFFTKTANNTLYRIIEASPSELSTQYIGISVKDSPYDGVNGGFFHDLSASGTSNIHYTRGQSINHLSNHEVNRWTFYISDDPRYDGNIRIGATYASTLSALESSVGKITFAIGGKDFSKEPTYNNGGDYDGFRARTVIARLNEKVHLIQSSKGVQIVQLKLDLVALGYSLSSAVNLDGGGSSHLKWKGTTHMPGGENRKVPYMIKLK